MGECRIPNLTVGRVSTEVGCIQIYGKNADALKLGDASREGGDIKVYRDTSGNLQLSLDADAASNAKALDVYGGVVFQNYLTVGQASLNTSYEIYSAGAIFAGTYIVATESIFSGASHGISVGATGIAARSANQASMPINIDVTSGTATHQIKLQIDANDIIVVQATGDDAGGVTALKARMLHPTYIEAPADADALILGHATQEAGDIKVYRDGLGNLQLSLDADAASNALALSVYGGVVAQNYLTVGQTGLNTSDELYVAGTAKVTGSVDVSGTIYGRTSVNSDAFYARTSNLSSLPINIIVATPDATVHAIKLQIDANDIIVAQATGDGAGGVTALKARMLHPTYIEAPADADALILGHATQEAGDIKVYRDVSGNLQLSLDADAASNALALSVYGGVVAQNYLTVGQTGLNTSDELYVAGTAKVTGSVDVSGTIYGRTSVNSDAFYARTDNLSSLPINITVVTPDATVHAIKLQIDANDIIIAQATGDGAGGVTALKARLLHPTYIEAPADADALILGHATQEAGDIKVYRDVSGNLQLSLDADAASNAKALDVYGGVVCQNYLTVGHTALDITNPFVVVGNSKLNGSCDITGTLYGRTSVNSDAFNARTNNLSSLPINIVVANPDATDHAVKLQIDANDIIVAQATGDGAGGVTALKARMLHPTYIEAPADADALILGHATQEAGDIKVYRDGLGNLQLSLDADAASNAKALDVYGGVVFQNFLTVGRTTLDAGSYKLYVSGGARVTGTAVFEGDNHFNHGLIGIDSGYGLQSDTNAEFLNLNIPVLTPDNSVHSLGLQIDSSNIIVVRATGDGAGGVINQAIGLFGVTPQVQQAHIADVAAAAGDPPTKAEFDAFAAKFNTLLADLEGYGALASS